MYHITHSFFLLPVSVVPYWSCLYLTARSSFTTLASVEVETVEADRGFGFPIPCPNPRPSSLLPGSGSILAFGPPWFGAAKLNVCSHLTAHGGCMANLQGGPEVSEGKHESGRRESRKKMTREREGKWER